MSEFLLKRVWGNNLGKKGWEGRGKGCPCGWICPNDTITAEGFLYSNPAFLRLTLGQSEILRIPSSDTAKERGQLFIPSLKKSTWSSPLGTRILQKNVFLLCKSKEAATMSSPGVAQVPQVASWDSAVWCFSFVVFNFKVNISTVFFFFFFLESLVLGSIFSSADWYLQVFLLLKDTRFPLRLSTGQTQVGKPRGELH